MNSDVKAPPQVNIQEKKSRLVDRIRHRLAEVDAALVSLDTDMASGQERIRILDAAIASNEADLRRSQERVTEEEQAADLLLGVLDQQLDDLGTLDGRHEGGLHAP